MRIIGVSNAERFLRAWRQRRAGAAPGRRMMRRSVESIISDVRRNGDAALRRYERRFGAAGISPSSPLKVSAREIAAAYRRVPADQLAAVRLARSRLAAAESALKRRLADTRVGFGGGTVITKSFAPIGSVGCYVPGGAARYPSSAVMSVTPARIAGVPRIVVVSPPAGASGRIDPLTVAAADMCGAHEIYRTGGAQAVAALAFGTRSIGRVDKIVGPGGAFVTIAKQIVSSEEGGRSAAVSVDMTAGPTELGVVVDSAADAGLAALDLVSQAEHSEDTLCFALATSGPIADGIRSNVESVLGTAGRSGIARASLESNGFIAVCRDPRVLTDVANGLAPEHMEILGKNPRRWRAIRSPGLVLEGRYTPAAASDYLLGSNHVLPTGGSGRTRGSLSVLDFVKLVTRARAGRRDLQGISARVKSLALAEGLPGHYEAVRGRL